MRSLYLCSVALLLSLTFTACTTLRNFGVYKIDIQQGNLITNDQLAKVKTGMSRNDVRTVLGTPLLQDVFHNNRWDYYFSYAPATIEQDKHKITILFENEKVARIEGQGLEKEIFTGGGEIRQLPEELRPKSKEQQ